MTICFDKETLSTISDIFEILTPLTLLSWFFHARWVNFVEAYFREIVGQYGGFVQETINASDVGTRYDGGLTMEIFDIDENGNFRGQFEYYEHEVKLGEVGGRAATERPVHESVNFFYGKLKYRWNFKFYKDRSPLLWRSNRLYIGQLRTVNRFDGLYEREEDTLQRVYRIVHHRESRIIEFEEKLVNRKDFDLPKRFTLFQEIGQSMLDPYNNVKKIFGDRLFMR